MRELGRVAPVDGRVYLTGGATAVLKEALNLNVELAAPSDFIPLPVTFRKAVKELFSE